MRPAWVVIGVVLVFASACAAQTDWIDRTLVTVDVTGTWEGTQTTAPVAGTSVYAVPIELVLEQKGAKVSGELKGVRNLPGGTSWSSPTPIPIEGTVSGDRFSFYGVRGTKMHADLQVKGDEMTGEGEGFTRFNMTLRRRQ